MSNAVCLLVSFPCNDYEGIAPVARRHLAALPDGTIEEVRDFLADIGTRRGDTHGSKGGLCVWSTADNYTRVDLFVEQLRPFWAELYMGTHVPGTLFCVEVQVVVLYQAEHDQAQGAAYVIGFDGRCLRIDHRTHLPLGWFCKPWLF